MMGVTALPLRSRPRRPLTWLIVLAAAIGIASSIYFNRRLFDLRRQRAQLAEDVGLLEVTDPKRVHVSRVPVGPDEIPPGVEAAHVWKYRIYLPAGYGPCLITGRRAIAADSPRSVGGSDRSSSSKNQDPVETVLTIALIKQETGWIFSRALGGSSSSSALPDDLPVDSLDELVVETAVTAQTPSQSFSVDEPICLLRLRGREPIEPQEGQPTLYPGIVTYLMEFDRREAFEQWAEGKTDQMPEVQR
ncbi:hypothetical protein NZK35_02715 [Stieleria sp. ICT_E10.1]|uniref:hypothetical protein n=1 Tax=Stieleria sedimenti TaxID=2976331 RepID=UPI002180627F|nr:hypothetical protein [Stieleria sedimenti]MCS7465582.1 hypothetical protein [Stieleria sedimenti]